MLPLLPTTTKTHSSNSTDKDSLWITVNEVFFAPFEKRTTKDSRCKKSFLFPSTQYCQHTEAKHIWTSKKQVTKRKTKEAGELSEMMEELKAIDMTDGVKKIKELIRIKKKTDHALETIKQREKEMVLRRRNQEKCRQHYIENKKENLKKIQDEKRLTKNCYNFVAQFAISEARREADLIVNKQSNLPLWSKAYEAALKYRLSTS